VWSFNKHDDTGSSLKDSDEDFGGLGTIQEGQILTEDELQSLHIDPKEIRMVG